MKIGVVGMGLAPPRFLGDELARTFRCTVLFFREHLDKGCLNGKRNQYDAGELLLSLKKRGCDKVIGICDVDIYAPGSRYVFGLAGGERCIVSTKRLGTGKILRERLVKETVHELGHTFGLLHCKNKKCVMSFSNTIKGVDRKGKGFCRGCMEKLEVMAGVQ